MLAVFVPQERRNKTGCRNLIKQEMWIIEAREEKLHSLSQILQIFSCLYE